MGVEMREGASGAMSLLPLFLSPSSQLNPKCRQFSASQGLKLYAKPPVPPPPSSPNAALRLCVLPGPGRGEVAGGGKEEGEEWLSAPHFC